VSLPIAAGALLDESQGCHAVRWRWRHPFGRDIGSERHEEDPVSLLRHPEISGIHQHGLHVILTKLGPVRALSSRTQERELITPVNGLWCGRWSHEWIRKLEPDILDEVRQRGPKQAPDVLDKDGPWQDFTRRPEHLWEQVPFIRVSPVPSTDRERLARRSGGQQVRSGERMKVERTNIAFVKLASGPTEGVTI
jgi:hypothetical protein